MPFVRRNAATGQIDSLHRQPSAEAQEFLADAHPEVQAFVGSSGGGGNPRREDFDRLDADFVRVIEDVIDTLIVKNVINITDLPAEAQAKLFARKSFRERITKNSLRLFGDSGFADVVDDTNFTDLT
jgi:hypothetical protein